MDTKKAILTALLTLSMACGGVPAPVPVTPPLTPASWRVDAVACATAGDVPYACERPIAGAAIQMHGPAGYITKTADGAGYAVFTLPAGFADSDAIVSALNYVTTGTHIDVAGTHDSAKHNIIVLPTAHVDPSMIPLGTLAAIRGAMWPGRMSIGYGPRPGNPDNILALDFFGIYDQPTRTAMLTQYHDGYGYTHGVAGPMSGTDCYHDKYPCHDPNNLGWIPQEGAPSQAQWDYYLDRLQEMWDFGCLGTGKVFPACGVASVNFIHPDGWTFEQTRDVFTQLLQQPRAQKLIRIVVPSGWEPTRYDWSSCTWALYFQWARQILPNALVLAHSVTDTDGLVGVDALCNDNNNPGGVGDGWRHVVPYLHGWLIQNGPYYTSPDDDPTLAWNFHAQFLESGDGATAHSVAWHFAGNAGWPTSSAWGANIPLCLYNAENTSYAAFWNNLPMRASIAWGDLAMSGASVACGYLDGGSVSVPVRR